MTLYESDAHTFNLIATPGFDRVFFSRKDLQNVIVPLAAVAPASFARGTAERRRRTFPVGRRHTTYLAGPEWMFRHRDFIGQVERALRSDRAAPGLRIARRGLGAARADASSPW